MAWKAIFGTGAFGGVAPTLLRLAINLTQNGGRISDQIDSSIVIGIAIFAILGGGLAVIWKETDLKKVFYIGLGIPSLLTVAGHALSTPQGQPIQSISAPDVRVPQQAPTGPPGGSVEGAPKHPASLFRLRVFAQGNIQGRQLNVDLTDAAPEITQAPIELVFEPSGGYVPVPHGVAIVNVPPTATSFRIQGEIASSDPIDLPSAPGSTMRVRFRSEKTSLSGFLYSLGIKRPPYQLIKESLESAVPTTDANDTIVRQLRLMASSTAIGKADDGTSLYEFALSIQAPGTVIGDIANVDYDLRYDPNPLLLSSSDAQKNFTAYYRGWGCYHMVDVTVAFKSIGTPPRKKTFDMCSVLGW